MGTEIECKFLVTDRSCIDGLTGDRIVQGYIHNDKASCVRVRTKGDKAYLTVKGATEGLSRPEFEYEIPMDDAVAMLTMCGEQIVTKIRYEIPAGPHTWEVDVFGGEHEGLVLAEIELTSEDEDFIRPEWVGEDVSLDPRYLNANLALNAEAKSEAFWKSVEDSYAAMKADPEYWKAELEERAAWGITRIPAPDPKMLWLARVARVLLILITLLSLFAVILKVVF